MEQNMHQIDATATNKATAVLSRVIDGKTYTINLFFPSSKAETMQEKTERMLMRGEKGGWQPCVSAEY